MGDTARANPSLASPTLTFLYIGGRGEGKGLETLAPTTCVALRHCKCSSGQKMCAPYNSLTSIFMRFRKSALCRFSGWLHHLPWEFVWRVVELLLKDPGELFP